MSVIMDWLRLKLHPLSLVCFVFIVCAHSVSSHSQHVITKKNLQSHVAFLSSDALEGRLTGSLGEQLATQYVANLFHKLGLEPAGDQGTFFQSFDFTAGVSLGKRNSLSLITQKKTITTALLNKEWRPLSFSDSRSFESTTVVLAGYGIIAPAEGDLPAYNSYHGLTVKNKWVVVFRYTPEKSSNEQNHQISPYASLRYKAFIAKEQGAKGIIFVSGPNSNVQDELIPLSFDTSLSGSGLVAISVKDSVIDALLKTNGGQFNSLKKIQDRLDSGLFNVNVELMGIKLMGQIDVQQHQQRGRNVLARLRVSDAAQQILIVGAHADHLGRGEVSGSRSREHDKRLIHYGADDNASGVASVIEAAITLSDLMRHNKLQGHKDILFAVWSGEELGLIGSSHFVKNFIAKAANKSLRPSVDININLDMVGRLRESLILQGVGSSSLWPKLIEQVNIKHVIPLVINKDPYLPTDSTSFYVHGVPTLNLFTGSHDEYHTARDTPQTLNYNGMKKIAEFLVDVILAVEDESKLFDYQRVAKTTERHGRGFRVYLGTIPDYTSTDLAGLTLSGITKDSPAELAGLKGGDVITQLAGKTIHDIYDYTFVLSALPIGRPAPVVVQRGKKIMTLTIVARSRE